MCWKKTPTGYVITSAKITRAGPVEYYGHELGVTGAQANLPVIARSTSSPARKPSPPLRAKR